MKSRLTLCKAMAAWAGIILTGFFYSCKKDTVAEPPLPPASPETVYKTSFADSIIQLSKHNTVDLNNDGAGDIAFITDSTQTENEKHYQYQVIPKNGAEIYVYDEDIPVRFAAGDSIRNKPTHEGVWTSEKKVLIFVLKDNWGSVHRGWLDDHVTYMAFRLNQNGKYSYGWMGITHAETEEPDFMPIYTIHRSFVRLKGEKVVVAGKNE